MTMMLDTKALTRFEPIRDRDEEIFWIGKPAFVPFILTGIPFLIFGFLWGGIDYFGFIQFMTKMPN